MHNDLQIPNNGLSLLRPAWRQYDLFAYRHLHLQSRTIENHFTGTHGFRTKEDLAYAKRGRRR